MIGNQNFTINFSNYMDDTLSCSNNNKEDQELRNSASLFI